LIVGHVEQRPAGLVAEQDFAQVVVIDTGVDLLPLQLPDSPIALAVVQGFAADGDYHALGADPDALRAPAQELLGVGRQTALGDGRLLELL